MCFDGAIDINEAMVREGHAVAFRRYRMDYVAAEEEARRGRRGLWAGSFQVPEEWRRERRH